jgi:hypothetical protein
MIAPFRRVGDALFFCRQSQLEAHNAAMECYRRAMIKEQTLEGHREALSQANKL